MADQDRRQPVRQRLRRGQSEFEDPRADGPQRTDADPAVRVRRDPDAFGRKIRGLPAGRRPGAGRMSVMAVLADGQRAVSRRRLRPLLCLCADQDRIRHRPLRHGGEAPARRARPAPRRQRISCGQGVHHRRHGHLAVVRRAGKGAGLRRRRISLGARIQERAALDGRDRKTPGGETRAHGQPHLGRSREPAARTPRCRRFRHQDAGQDRPSLPRRDTLSYLAPLAGRGRRALRAAGEGVQVYR